ncbi:transposase, partial [Streptomyces erythrochromogenes]|uniref:transposase n=1 Tax=Streptomyces erythrochromogenes TaxID=285574 RepID=UPI003692A354
LVRAHIRLGGPIVVVRDNLNTHLATGLKRYEAGHDWLTTVRLPAYAPDLNPIQAVWSLVRRATAKHPLRHPPTTSTAHFAARYAESNSALTSSTAAPPPPT